LNNNLALSSSSVFVRKARPIAVAIALISVAAWCTTVLAQPTTTAAPQTAQSGALTQTITFLQPRVSGKGRSALKKFAQKIVPSKKNAYQLERVDIDVYINPASDEFARAASANMGNEVARRLVRYGVPRDKIAHATQGVEREQTRRGTYDVELKATGVAR